MMQMKNNTMKIVLGILTALVSISFIIYFAPRISNIYDLRSLKWFPMFSAFLGFYLAGWITRDTSKKLLAALFLAILVYIPIRYFYFPMLLYLVFAAIWALALNRKEVKRGVKIILSVVGIAIFTYLLVDQPLIIKKNGFKKEADGTLVNAKVVWDFSDNEVPMLTDEVFSNDLEEQVVLTDFEGKVIYLSFWATWCGPCIAEKPKLEKLKEDFRGNENLVFIDISLDKNKEKWLAFLDKHKPEGIQLLSSNEGMTRRNFGFLGTPHHVLVNAKGQYKSLRDISSAEKFLLDEAALNNWIAMGAVVVEAGD